MYRFSWKMATSQLPAFQIKLRVEGFVLFDLRSIPSGTFAWFSCLNHTVYSWMCNVATSLRNANNFFKIHLSLPSFFVFWSHPRTCVRNYVSDYVNIKYCSVDKKNQLDVTFCILYFSSNSCSTCFGQPCAHHQELTTAWCYSLVLVCAVAAGRWSSP